MKMGRRRRRRAAAATAAFVMRGIGLAVQLMTMSASVKAWSSWLSSTAVPLISAASVCARLRVRLAITIRLTPAAEKCRAVSAIISPAPNHEAP